MIVELPNKETVEFPDDISTEQVEKILAQQFPKPEYFTTEELGKARIKPYGLGTIPELGLRALEGAFLAPSALYHGFWEASRQFGKGMAGEKPEYPLQPIEEFAKQAIGPLMSAIRPLGVPPPELVTPSKIAGIEGLAGLPLDILADPLLPVMFGKSVMEKIGRRGIPEAAGLISKYFREPIAPTTFPTIEELREPRTVIPGVGIRANLPMVVEEPKPLPKPLFEFKMYGKKVVGPREIMGADLTESRIGRAVNVEVAAGQGEEKIFKVIAKTDPEKVYTELGITGNTELGTLDVNKLKINGRGIEPTFKIIKPSPESQAFVDNLIKQGKAHSFEREKLIEQLERPANLEINPIKGLFEHVYKSLEKYAKENNYKVIRTNAFGDDLEKLKELGYNFISGEEINKTTPYLLTKRMEQHTNFIPDFSQRLKTLKISQEIGFLNAQKASEINDMALRRSMLFDVSPKKEYTFFDKLGNQLNKFKNIDEAENFVKGIKITPTDYWITQQAAFRRAETLYRKTIENVAAKNIDEAVKYPTAFKPEIIAPTYRKFIKPEKKPIVEITEPLEPVAKRYKITDNFGNVFYTSDKLIKGEMISGTTYVQKVEEISKPVVEAVVKLPEPEIKMDAAIESINNVFDTGTGEIVALGNKVIPIRESLFNVLKSIKEIPNDFYERIVTAKGWLKTPQQFFEQQSDKRVKEVFYRRIKFAEKNNVVELENLKKETNQLRKSLNLNNKNFNRIGTYAIAQDENGLKTLQIMKKEIPILTNSEIQFYNFIRSKYEEFFNRINQAREFVGIKPIDYRGDYFTFFRNYDELEKLGYHITDGSLTENINKFVHKTSTVFMHEKIRKGGIIPLETNAFDVFSAYATRALEHIHMTPAIGINRALLKDMLVDGEMFSVKDNAPRFYVWMNKWLDDIAGQRAITEIPHFLERMMNALNRNIVYSMLGFNIRSALIQPSALVHTLTEIGPKYLMRGIFDWLKSPMLSKAMRKSNVLKPREYEQSVAEAFKMVKEPGLFTKFL